MNIVNIAIIAVPTILGVASNITSKTKMMSCELDKFFVRLILPTIMLYLISTKEIKIFSVLKIAGLYYLLASIFLFLIYHVYSKLNQDYSNINIDMALASSFSNLILVGVPVLTFFHRGDLLSIVFTIIPLHSICLIFISSCAKGVSKKLSKPSISKLPVLSLALIIGLTISQTSMSHILRNENLINFFSIALQCLSLFVLGSYIFKDKIDLSKIKPAILISMVKVIIMPAFFYLIINPFSIVLSRNLAFIASLPIGLSVLGLVSRNNKVQLQIISLAIVISSISYFLFTVTFKNIYEL